MMPGSVSVPVLASAVSPTDSNFHPRLGVDASIKALTVANVRPTDIDLIICTIFFAGIYFPGDSLFDSGSTRCNQSGRI